MADDPRLAFLQQFIPPNMREQFLPTRAAAGQILTLDEALLRIENIANALHHSPRVPVDVSVERGEGGTMTIRVVPHPSATGTSH